MSADGIESSSIARAVETPFVSGEDGKIRRERYE
jgi:hypothetical protein